MHGFILRVALFLSQGGYARGRENLSEKGQNFYQQMRREKQ
jgi:hypothetical protein